MSNPKFKVGQRIITKDGVEGHVTLIVNPFSDNRVYYCSMYPGAQANYHYVECIDLLCTNYCEQNERFTTLQALNLYTETELLENKVGNTLVV